VFSATEDGEEEGDKQPDGGDSDVNTVGARVGYTRGGEEVSSEVAGADRGGGEGGPQVKGDKEEDS